jgi:D-alanyl-lipoteichoic acid acyltransferase DltB (MBOAT superfamily)
MNFVSLQFLAFMAIVYPTYLVLPHRAQNVLLVVASYVFYGAWDWRFLGLLGFATTVDYFVALGIEGTDDLVRRRRYLLVSLCTQLGILAVFKYFNFFIASMQELVSAMGIPVSIPMLSVILPVGLSFYTFQSLAYTIDVYRGKVKPTRNFITFMLYCAFFPQLVAGPIERAREFLPQLEHPRTVTADRVSRGLVLILLGYVKKVVISDGFAQSVNSIYGAGGPVSAADVILATYCFAVQIYCDFSGYTDIARGLAKLLGIDLRINFNLPYFSTNPSEFWRRWHISLSTWLRDYLYIPLGGNRFGEWLTYRNLLMTMLLGGLWHGAAWNFVLWGLFHGVVLCMHRALTHGHAPEMRVRSASDVLRMLLYLQVTCYGWLLFRAGSLAQVVEFTSRLFTGWGQALSVSPPPMPALVGLAGLVVWEIAEYLTADVHFYRRWPVPVRGAAYACMLFVLCLGLSNAPAQFIYFQF